MRVHYFILTPNAIDYEYMSWHVFGLQVVSGSKSDPDSKHWFIDHSPSVAVDEDCGS